MSAVSGNRINEVIQITQQLTSLLTHLKDLLNPAPKEAVAQGSNLPEQNEESDNLTANSLSFENPQQCQSLLSALFEAFQAVFCSSPTNSPVTTPTSSPDTSRPTSPTNSGCSC